MRGFFAANAPVTFRAMTLGDIDSVMAIERSSFAYPWSLRFFLQEFQTQCSRALVAESEGKVAGYVLFWLLPDSIDVHNIAVHTAFRRRGIGRALLQQVVRHAQERGVARVTLEVRRSNFPAQKLYQSLGFLMTGIRKGYYSDDGEDAFAMALELGEERSKLG
ncbi:MAG TPA: ribosomal protein S18-alanine N-acetyltransferase [Candidatus Eisenbacteria bacterium]|nr:ribosomal protein S18-alanine N-acetyltransferase [Candidatus Eisenbacteria bacterium]